MARTTKGNKPNTPPVEEPKLLRVSIEPQPLHCSHTVRLSIAGESVELQGSAKDFAIFARTMTQIAERLAAGEDA